jgi:sterol desaturase/sphingolipid hydroxylase (fatty acid hydroxylase superfamily)
MTIVYAVPAFFALMGVEMLANRARFGSTRYRLVDSIANLGCGLGQQLIGVFVRGLGLGAYTLVYQHARLATIPARSVLAWVLVFLGADLGYYVFHRVSHRVGFMWAAHVVHHQSEEYNLSVALRQSWLDQLVEWVFYTPLALAGFSPAMFVAVFSFNTLYAFWPHTRAIGRLGPLEWIINTPSAHRVHHAMNAPYLDKNYGGVLIIWDRLFGTFERERGAPVFGTPKPLGSASPLTANARPWLDLWAAARGARGLLEKARVWCAPPASTFAPAVASPPPSAATALAPATATFAAASFALLLLAAVAFLWLEARLEPAARLALGAALMAWLCVAAAVIERRRGQPDNPVIVSRNIERRARR